MKKFQFSFLFGLLFFVFCNGQFKNYTKLEKLQRLDQKKIGWGFSFGLNQFSFDLEENPNFLEHTIDAQGGGISISLMGFYNLNNRIDITLEPSMHFLERTFVKPNDEKIALSTTYLDVPLFIKLNGNRWGNSRPYIKAGAGYTLNLESKEGNGNISPNEIVLTRNNFNLQPEMGVEIYFDRFKFTPYVKGIFFMNEELVKDESSEDWINSINSLQTRAVVFALRFQ